MKVAFIYIDIDSDSLIVSFPGITKKIKIRDLEQNEIFFDELYRKMDKVELVVQTQEVKKHEFYEFLDSFKESKKVRHQQMMQQPQQPMQQPQQPQQPMQQPQQPQQPMQQPQQPQQPMQQPQQFYSQAGNGEYEYNIQNSKLYRNASGRKLCIDSLNKRLNNAADHIDLSLYDDDIIYQNSELAAFIQNGYLVQTTLQEIRELEKEVKEEMNKKLQQKESRDIVEREDIMQDDGKYVISSGEHDFVENDHGGGKTIEANYGSGSSMSTGNYREQRTIGEDSLINTDNGEISAGDIMDLFGGDPIEKMTQNGREPSMGDLLRKT